MIRICIFVSVTLSLLFVVFVINSGNYNTLLKRLPLNNKNRDDIVNKKNNLQEFGHSLRRYLDVLIGPMVLGATAYIMHAIVSWGVNQLQKHHGESDSQINVDVSLKLQRDVDKRVLNLEKRISHLEHHYSLLSTESIITEDHLKEESSHSKSAVLQISMENMYLTNKLNSYIMQSTSDLQLHSPCSFSVEPLQIYEIDPSNYTLRTQQNPTKNRVRHSNSATWQFDNIAVTLNDTSRDTKSIESNDVHRSINDSEILLSVTELEVTDSTVLDKSSNNRMEKPDDPENQSNQNDVIEGLINKKESNSKQIQKDDPSCRRSSCEKYYKTSPYEKFEYLVSDFLDSEQCTNLSKDASEKKSRITVTANDNKEHDSLSNTQSGERSGETVMIVDDAICQVEIDVVSSDIEIDTICDLSTDTQHGKNSPVLEDRNKHLNGMDTVNSKPDSDNNYTGRGRTNQRRCISHYQRRRKEIYGNNNPRIRCKKDSIGGKPSKTNNITESLDKPSMETAMSERNVPNRKNKQSIAGNNNVRVVSERQHKQKNKI